MNPLDFWEKYKSVGTAKSVSELCKNDEVTNCRFCGKGIPEVTFNSEAHIIPELLGQNGYTSSFECDSCNSIFSKYESHLATFFRPYLSMLNVRGKKKVPTFQSREENRDANSVTSLKSIDGKKRHLISGNIEDFEIDADSKTAKIIFRNESIIPKHIYKALIRIGLALLPEDDLHYHQKSFDWVIGSEVTNIGYIRVVFMTTLKNKKFEHPIATLYQAVNYSSLIEEFPNHVLVLGFANQIIQVYLPFSEDFDFIHEKNKKLSLDIFPGFAFDKLEPNSKVQIRTFDVNSDEKLKFDASMNFSFDKYERKESDTQQESKKH